jgi:type VI secretion system protein ImpG
VLKNYFLDELLFMRELSKEFSAANPDVAHYLSEQSRDPDVERMLEGFAFLAGRVRQQLDDEFPQLTHGLTRMLWPHYLRVVPSMAILEFQPVMQALRQSQALPRGTVVQSVDVDGTACRFRTSHDVLLHPLTIEEATIETRTNGNARLKLVLKLWNQAKIETLSLERLRLFLHGDPVLTHALALHLHRHVEEIRAGVGDAVLDRADAPYRTLTVEPSGFAEDQALLPYPPASHPAFRLLQEYFSLPEKFLFVDLVGLEGLTTVPGSDRIVIDVRFDRALPPTLRPSKDNVRLYCAPIVNLFEHEGDPLRIDRSQTDYRVRPSGSNPFHYEVFSIDQVQAFAPGVSEPRPVPDFYGFTHGLGRPPATYYFPSLRPSVVDDRVDAYVSFVDQSGTDLPLEAETVMFGLTCTNRRLPEALRLGDIKVATDSSPAFVQFRNITIPTPSVAPPLGGELHWRLISHLSLNYLSLVDVSALRGVLELYNYRALRDPQAARSNARRLEGLHAIRSEPANALVDGALVRGSAITLDVLEDRFSGDGDLYLFATLLNEFLSLHGTLNAFTQFNVHGLQSGETLSWPHRIGRDLL